MPLILYTNMQIDWLNKLSSAIYNDIIAGLSGLSSNPRISMEQLEDDIIDERLTIIKEYAIKGLVPYKDLYTSITCLEVDCKPIEKCGICGIGSKFKQTEIPHVEIPQIVNDLGSLAVDYFGTIDRETPFKVYTDISYQYHKYDRWIGRKPYVYIDTTPNENNMYDCYLFNVPLLKTVTIIAVFKDPRQVLGFSCCNNGDVINFNSIANDIKRRLTEKKVRWYRQLATPINLDHQTPPR